MKTHELFRKSKPGNSVRRSTNTEIDERVIWLKLTGLQILPQGPLRLAYHGKLMPRYDHSRSAVRELCTHLKHELVVLW